MRPGVGSRVSPSGRLKTLDGNLAPGIGVPAGSGVGVAAPNGPYTRMRWLLKSLTYTFPSPPTRTAEGPLNREVSSGLPPGPLEVKFGWPSTMSALCEPGGKRNTRLLPLSATQTYFCVLVPVVNCCTSTP